MIQKLLLVRKANSSSDLLDRAGVKAFAGPALNISPVAWLEEHGLSHYGFVLTDLKLADFQAVEKFVAASDGLTLLDHAGDVAETLADVGLRINGAA